MQAEKTEFEEKLRVAINQCCKENDSNTPDFILAKFLESCLFAFNRATRERDGWYGMAPSPFGDDKCKL